MGIPFSPAAVWLTRPIRTVTVVITVLAVFAAVLAAAPATPVAAQTGTGTCAGDAISIPGGTAEQEVAAARDSYTELCGQPYNDQSTDYRCDWTPNGWQCTGPATNTTPTTPAPTTTTPTTTTPPTPTTTAPPSVDGRCSGNPISIPGGTAEQEVAAARDSYTELCGQPYNDQSTDYRCDWTPNGWQCAGPSTNGTTPTTPTTPTPPSSPETGPLFDYPRDVGAKPPTPANVTVTDGALTWTMPTGPAYIYQVTRNGKSGGTAPYWNQIEALPGTNGLTYEDRGDTVAFSLPVNQFIPGDRFQIEAIHPWDTSVPDGAHRASVSSRFAMIQRSGSGQTIAKFPQTFGTGDLPEGAWIGNATDWNSQPQWSDDFSGSGRLVDEPGQQWYFATANPNSTEISPSPNRDLAGLTTANAVLRNDKLEMTADPNTGTYSYIGTANNDGDGYVIDPTNGVFVEASVRLDQMTPADNAWWAFWLMAPGSDGCDASGGPTPNGWSAYDSHARTGTEIDIFEFVPDLGNGFNQAIHRYEWSNQRPTCTDGQPALQPFWNSFTYEGNRDLPGVDLPSYSDGNYHRLGLYYAQDCLVFYIDDELIWKVDESETPGWVTPTPRESIRLSWEVQNTNNPWTARGGSFETTAGNSTPTVYIDWVNVWEKKESANGLCSGQADPAQTVDPDPLSAPTDVQVSSDGTSVALDWAAGPGGTPDGYDITRNGQGYWSVSDGTRFADDNVTPGQTYTYSVTPWYGSATDFSDRTYGPRSETVTIEVATSTIVLFTPQQFDGTYANDSITLTWEHNTIGTRADGYDISRDGQGYWTVSDTTTFVDQQVTPGQTYEYAITAWADDANGNRKYGPTSLAITVTADETSAPQPPGDPRDTTHPDWDPALDPDLAPGPVTAAPTPYWIDVEWSEWHQQNGGAADGYQLTFSMPLGPITHRVDDDSAFTFAPSGFNSLRPDQDVTYTIAAYKLVDGWPRLGAAVSQTVNTGSFASNEGSTASAYTNYEVARFSGIDAAVDQLLPDATDQQRTRISNDFWRAYYRFTYGIAAYPEHVDRLRLLLLDAGFDPGVPDTVTAQNADAINRLLVIAIADPYEAATFGDILPGFGPNGEREAYNSLRDMTLMSASGWTFDERAAQFALNQAGLVEQVDALPDDPQKSSASAFRQADRDTYTQATLILGFETPERRFDFHQILSMVELGIHPTALVHDGRDEQKVVDAPNTFSIMWNNASIDERAAYFGFDPVGWGLAAPFLRMSLQFDSVADDLTDWKKPFTTLLFATGIAVATGAIASAAYSHYFSATIGSFNVAKAVGATTGSYTSTYFLTGSTSEAEKAAFRSILASVATHFGGIAEVDRNWQDRVALAIVDGGFAELNEDGAFVDAMLASLAKQYIPGLRSYLEDLENVSPFAAELSTVMISSYIANGSMDEIGNDLRTYITNYLGGQVSDFVGDSLDDQWGTFGIAVGEIAGVAVATEGDTDDIRDAIALRAGQLTASSFANSESWQAQLSGDLASLATTAALSDDPSAVLDDGLQRIIFANAGSAIANGLNDQLTNAYGESPVIDISTGLVDVLIANLWQDADTRQALVADYLNGELRGAAIDQLGPCVPGGLVSLFDGMADVALDRALNGSGDDVADSVNDYLTGLVDSGGIAFDGVDLSCGEEEPPPCAGVSAVDAVVESSGSVTLPPVTARIAVIDVVTQPRECPAASVFAEWLLELKPDEITTDTITIPNGVTLVVTPRPGVTGPGETDLSQFRLRISGRNNVTGEIEQRYNPTGPWDDTGLVVHTVRTYNRVTDFVSIDELELDQIVASIDDPDGAFATVASFIQGCFSVVSEAFVVFMAALVEILQVDDPLGYLANKWAEFEELIQAFAYNPAQFFEEFLKAVFQVDLYIEDVAQWVGWMTCELAMALVPGVAAQRYSSVFSSFRERGGFDDFRGLYSDDSAGVVPIGCALDGTRSKQNCEGNPDGDETNAPAGLTPTSLINPPNSATFLTNASGQTTKVVATISKVFPKQSRPNAEKTAQLDTDGRLSDDEGGHLIGFRFLGPAGGINLVSQNENLNGSAYLTLENELATFVQNGATAKFTVEPLRYNADGRPEAIKVDIEYFVDGEPIHRVTRQFRNQAGETYTRIPTPQIKELIAARVPR